MGTTIRMAVICMVSGAIAIASAPRLAVPTAERAATLPGPPAQLVELDAHGAIRARPAPASWAAIGPADAGAQAVDVALPPVTVRVRREPADPRLPTRQSIVRGIVPIDGKLADHDVLVAASPRAKAAKLIELLAARPGMIAVSSHGAIAPLRLDLVADDRDDDASWIEVRVDATNLAFEAVPEIPSTIAWSGKTLDAAFAKAFSDAAARRHDDQHVPVDVLVTPDVDVQRLIDVLGALDRAGARVIGLGDAPDDVELAKRGHRIPHVVVAAANPAVRGQLERHLPELDACYAKVAAGRPELAGTIDARFAIAANGTVHDAPDHFGIATGVDPDVAACIAGVIRSLTFPRSAGTQVAFPLLLKS